MLVRCCSSCRVRGAYRACRGRFNNENKSTHRAVVCHIGPAWLPCGMNETVTRYEKMVEQFPQNELARFSLGKALFDAGDFRRAKEQLEIALVKKPDWMVVQILIGKCELALGHPASAKAAFENALRLAIDQNHEGPQMEMEQALAELDS